MIAGNNGFCHMMVEEGYDDDLLVEYLTNISNINGITTRCTDSTVDFEIQLDGEYCTILSFSKRGCLTNKPAIRSFLSEHGHLPFEADEYFSDIHEINGIVPIPDDIELCDKIALAIYRLLHTLTYHD